MPVPIKEAPKDIAVDVHVITEEELLKGPYLFMGEWRHDEYGRRQSVMEEDIPSEAKQTEP